MITCSILPTGFSEYSPKKRTTMKKVLFVCLGNICRSAMAHGILEAELVRRGITDISVDSAGTSNWHIGSPPDDRAIATTARHNIDISDQRARQVSPADFLAFDLIIAMDSENHAKLKNMAPAGQDHKLVKCLDFGTLTNASDVPDPYYGGPDGFNQVMVMLQDACQGIADRITST